MGVAAGLTLRDFWRLTPYSLQVVLAGYAKRVEHQYQIAAFTAANIMNMWTKKRIRPAQLLGSSKKTVSLSSFKSFDDVAAYMARQQETAD